MTPPPLRSARLTLGPATPDHTGAFIAFCATEQARFIGGPAGRGDAWEGAAIGAGLCARRGFGPVWTSADGEPVWRAEPEPAWTIYPAHQGKGFATEAALVARQEAPHPTDDRHQIMRRRHRRAAA